MCWVMIVVVRTLMSHYMSKPEGEETRRPDEEIRRKDGGRGRREQDESVQRAFWGRRERWTDGRGFGKGGREGRGEGGELGLGWVLGRMLEVLDHVCLDGAFCMGAHGFLLGRLE